MELEWEKVREDIESNKRSRDERGRFVNGYSPLEGSLTRGVLEKLYIKEGLSTRGIAKKIGVGHTAVYNYLHKFGICRTKSESLKRERNPQWNGGRHRRLDGYVQAYAPEHPANYRGYVPEHRLVMEQHLGRFLTKNEQVHHRNGIRDDNRIENLEIVIKSAHYGKVKCPFCDKTFLVR